MKRFLRGRLHASDKGYDYYIPPFYEVGKLYKAVANDLLGDNKKLLFLQNHNGVITFGVREPLSLFDFRGRVRCNFMGYQLGQNERLDLVPSLASLRSRFPDITAEAHECHNILDNDSRLGLTMQATAISFPLLPYIKDNAWDRSVLALLQNPDHPVLLTFDEHGDCLSLGDEFITVTNGNNEDHSLVRTSGEMDGDASYAIRPSPVPYKSVLTRPPEIKENKCYSFRMPNLFNWWGGGSKNVANTPARHEYRAVPGDKIPARIAPQEGVLQEDIPQEDGLGQDEMDKLEPPALPKRALE